MFKTSFCLFLLIIIAQLLSCSSVSQFERNRRLWQERRIENYDFELQRSAEGMGGDWTLTFKVRDNKPLPVFKNNEDNYPPSFQYEKINSVEKIFDYIQQQSKNEEYNLTVEYDEEYGFPRKVRLLGKMSNGRVSLEIKRFEIVESVEPTESIVDENFKKEWQKRYDATVAELERNHRLWEESSIVNYDFEISKGFTGVSSDWGRSPVLIKVRDGEKISIVPVDKKDISIYAKTDGFENFDTIDKLFAFIRQELEKGIIVEVEYDKEFGYPKQTNFDYSFAIDDEKGVTIEKFKVVK